MSDKELSERMRTADGMMAMLWEYQFSLWLCGDNRAAYAKRPEYGGALDAQELYPDIKLRTLDEVMREFAVDLKEESSSKDLCSDQ